MRHCELDITLPTGARRRCPARTRRRVILTCGSSISTCVPHADAVVRSRRERGLSVLRVVEVPVPHLQVVAS